MLQMLFKEPFACCLAYVAYECRHYWWERLNDWSGKGGMSVNVDITNVSPLVRGLEDGVEDQRHLVLTSHVMCTASEVTKSEPQLGGADKH